MPNLPSALKTRVTAILKQQGKTQSDLAKTLGKSQNAVWSAISGNPSLKTIEEIANALEVEIYELFIPDNKLEALEALEKLSKK